MSRIAFIRAWPRDPATGAPILVPLAGGGSATPYRRDGIDYRAGIATEPRFSAALGFDKTGWTGAALPTASVMTFSPSDRALLANFSGLHWPGATIEVDAGDEFAALARILTGAAADATVTDGSLSVAIADIGARLAVPAIQSYFAGTGGIEGAEITAGRVKRRSFGRVFNVEGRPFEPAYNIYEFGDPARPLQGWPALRDMGRAGDIALLPWQGSFDATLAALRNSAPPGGGGVVAPSIALAKWWTQPAGPLTADLLGEANGYVETVAAIADKLLIAANGPSLANLGAAIALQPAPAGLHLRDDRETWSAALDRLFLPVSLIWRPNATGAIDILHWSWDGVAEPVKGLFKGRERTFAPHKTRRVGYRRNERQQNDGEIAADILANEVRYSSGETAEQLKPAEGGADVTGNHTSNDTANVNGRPVAAVISDLDLNGTNWFDMAALEATRDAIMLARTTLAGMPIGTYVTSFKTEFTDEKSATAETFNLLGAKAGDGLSFLLDQSTVRVGPIGGGAGPTVSLSQRFQSINATLGGHTGSINTLNQVLIDPQTGATAKAVIALDVDGRMTGIVATATGTKSTLDMVFDAYNLLAPDGTSLIFASGGVVKMPKVQIDTILPGTKGTAGAPVILTEVDSVQGAGMGVPLVLMSSTARLEGPGTILANVVCKLDHPSGEFPWALAVYIDSIKRFQISGEGSKQDGVPLLGSLWRSAQGNYAVQVIAEMDYRIYAGNRTMTITPIHGDA